MLESKGINVPDSAINAPAVTAKDLDDLKAGVAMGVDAIAVSFVQTAADVETARAAAAAAGAPDIAVIAKIERPHAVADIAEIVRVSDAVMVARGDLGLELPLETLPAVQRRIVTTARARGVPVIVATEVLESMRTEPRPTRAEVTDAAHAVDEAADVIMLSGETAAGRYPVRAVAALDAIVREAEKMAEPPTAAEASAPEDSHWSPHGRALCEAAVALAARAKAVAIVAMTEAGHTARLLAALRPAQSILAATMSAQVAARLSLVWGVTPIVVDRTTLAVVREALSTRAIVPPGSVVVFVTSRTVLGRDGGNFVMIERL